MIRKTFKKLQQATYSTLLDKIVDPVWGWLDEKVEEKTKKASEQPEETYQVYVERNRNGKKDKFLVIDMEETIDTDELDNLTRQIKSELITSYEIVYNVSEAERPLIKALCDEAKIYVEFVRVNEDDDDDEKPIYSANVRTTQKIAHEIETKYIQLTSNQDTLAQYLSTVDTKLSKKLTRFMMECGLFNAVLVQEDNIKIVMDRGLYNRDGVEEDSPAILIHENAGVWDRYVEDWTGFKFTKDFWRRLRDVLNDLEELK